MNFLVLEYGRVLGNRQNNKKALDLPLTRHFLVIFSSIILQDSYTLASQLAFVNDPCNFETVTDSYQDFQNIKRFDPIW